MKYFALLLLLFTTKMGIGQQHWAIDGGTLLGYQARELSNQNKTGQDVEKQQLDYQAVNAETSHLYVSIESYASVAAAQKMMTWLNAQNRGMQGWEQAPGFGDEAIRDSDGEHFRLVIVRTGNRIIRLKINRLTPRSASLQTLLQAARDITVKEK